MLVQELTIYLKSGETVSLAFKAKKADELHPQIEAFFKSLDYWKHGKGSFRFQGECEAFVLLADVSAAKVNSYNRNESVAW